MLKLCMVTKVKVFFPVLVCIVNFNLLEFSATILKKGLLDGWVTSWFLVVDIIFQVP